MRAQFLKYFSDIRSSYWFIPSVMSIMAIALSFAMTALDSKYGESWLHEIGWLYANQPSGARAVLSTIAGSMITVAGVTFSMTIVAVSYATGQLGPRLISNFMRDTSNQVTLGTFIGTFIYCLLVLRTVRDSNGIPENSADAISAFVPHMAILFGLLSAIISVAVLINFIHHIPESINVSNLTAKIGKEMKIMVDELFPIDLGDPTSEKAYKKAIDIMPEDFYASAVSINARCDGYIQVLDEAAILNIATENDLILRVEYRPGDFITSGKTLMLAWPPGNVNDDTKTQCHRTFAFGIQRTSQQNILFLTEQLIEIIARALSPGVNDPFTAVSSIDWLQAMLSKLITKDSPSEYRSDDDGNLRVIVHPVTFERTLNTILDQIRPYVCSDRIASLRVMRMIAELAVDIPTKETRVSLLLKHAKNLSDAAQQAMKLEIDHQEVEKQYNIIQRLLDDPVYRDKMKDSTSWLEGSG